MKKYILESFDRNPVNGEVTNEELAKVSNTTWLGHALCLTPFEARVAIDFTGPPGSTTSIYYSLVFQLLKWEYFVQKANEWIEVSPVHAQYYQLTHKQKEELEGRIKAGLVSSAQSVADLELLLHDKRKYEEMLRYMGYRTPKEVGDKDIKEHSHHEGDMKDLCLKADDDGRTRKEREKRIDNHSLKAMFIDQVDFHTGEGISMRSIVSRWPTMISDFMKMDDTDLDPDKVMKKLDISRAEAVVLVTKNKLFNEWKTIFLPEVRSRYERIGGLVKGREKSVEQYREWLKPYIAKHKMIQEGLATSDERGRMLTSFMTPVGHALSMSEIELWVWRDFVSPEIHRTPGEFYAYKPIDPYDGWTKRNLIFSKDQGLVIKYPWITDRWVKEKKEEFLKGTNPPWLTWNRDYYSFFVIKFKRTNLRSATGEEIENGVFDVNLVFMSQNVLLVKLLELKAKQEEFEMYVDSLLGMPHPHHAEAIKKERRLLGPVRKFFDIFSIPLQFVKPGPYERDFEERITKYLLRPVAGDRYVPIVNFIKQKMGYGG